MESMRKIWAAAVFSAAGLVAFNVVGQECYRSTECEGNRICVDLACVASEEPQTVCLAPDACSSGEVCDQGVCKPDGVACANDFGWCVSGSPDSYCRCDSGHGIGMSEGCDGSGCDTAPPSDEELYARCTEFMIGTCEAPPDVATVCTEEQIATCTTLIPLLEALNGNCSADDVPVDIDTETVTTDWATDVESSDMGDAPPVQGGGAPTQPNAWEMAECCEELTEIEESPEEKAYLDCAAALAPDDCEGFAKCEALLPTDIGIDPGGDDGDTETPVDVNEVCNAEQAEVCNEVLMLRDSFEELCSGEAPMDSDGSSDGSVDLDSEVSVDVETDGSSGDEAGSGTDETAPDPGAGKGDAYTPDPWEVAACCDELASGGTDPAVQSYSSCLAALAPDDCEGYLACEELYNGDISIGKDDADTDASADTDVSGDVDVDSDEEPSDVGTDYDADEDKDTEADSDEENEHTETSDENGDDGNVDTDADSDGPAQTDDTDGAADTENTGASAETSKSGGGCSVVVTDRPTDMFALLVALF